MQDCLSYIWTLRQRTRILFMWVLVLFPLFALPVWAQTDYWSPAAGPWGGTSVWSIVPMDDGTFVAAAGSGLYTSADQGATWSAIPGSPTGSIRDVRILADGSMLAAVYARGVYRGSSTGAWSLAGLEYQFVQSVFESPEGTWFAGTTGALYRKEPAFGWEAIALDGALVPVRFMTFNQDYLFAATAHGVYRSADDGRTWEFSSFGMQDFNVLTLAVNTAGHVFAGVESASGSCAVYRSRGNGGFWTCTQPRSNPLLVSELLIDDTGDLIAGAYGSILRSKTDGDSWSIVTPMDGQVESLVQAGSDFLAGTSTRAVSRINPLTRVETASSTGIGSETNHLLITDDEEVLVATNGGVFSSMDHGSSWTRLSGEGAPATDAIRLAEASDGALLVGTASGLYRADRATDDSRPDWSFLGPPGAPAIQDIAVDEDGRIVVGYHAGIFIRSGSTWTERPIVGADQAHRGILSVHVTRDGTILAGAAWDSWRLEPGTQEWQLMSAPGIDWFDVQVFEERDGRILAGTRLSGVLQSNDDGRSWRSVGRGLAGQEDVRDIAFGPTGIVHIGTFGTGAFQLNPWTNQWLPMNTGLKGNHRVTALAIDRRNNAYAGTDAGLYRHLVSTRVGIENAESQAITSWTDPWPNPARERISFHARGHIGRVSIELYDLLGRRVATTAFLSSDQIEVDTSMLAPGMYLYRIVENAKHVAKTGTVAIVR